MFKYPLSLFKAEIITSLLVGVFLYVAVLSNRGIGRTTQESNARQEQQQTEILIQLKTNNKVLLSNQIEIKKMIREKN